MSVIKLIYFNDWYIKIPVSKTAGKIDAKARYQVVHGLKPWQIYVLVLVKKT